MKIKFSVWAITTLSIALTAQVAFGQQAQPRAMAARTVQNAASRSVPNMQGRSLAQPATPYLIQDTQPRASYQPVPVSPAIQPAGNLPNVAPAPSVTSYNLGDGAYACDCQQPDCHRCRLRGRRAAATGCSSCGTDCDCVQCPRCDDDVCRLSLVKGKESKTCFKVEQKSVCIPAVRMPWQTCCPPGSSKTRLVTRLKVHKYECPSCSYKWAVQKPESNSSQPTEAPQAKAPEKAKEPTPENKVPKAPVLKGAFRNWGLGRR